MCPRCHSTDLGFEAATGRGIVYSYAFLHHPRHPAFDYPVLAALVELDEGVRLMTNLVDVDPLDVRVGLPVEVTFADTAGGGVVPVFRPVSGEPGRGSS
ncbi:MAG: hypothetical protein JWN62_4506 [Acidimicrobiales bacterium]|nr:hypothetical protein [Acidimicrobiales bacterium]